MPARSCNLPTGLDVSRIHRGELASQTDRVHSSAARPGGSQRDESLIERRRRADRPPSFDLRPTRGCLWAALITFAIYLVAGVIAAIIRWLPGQTDPAGGQSDTITRPERPANPTERIVMSHMTAAKKSSMGAWMILAGVLAAIAGWMTRNYAASQMQEALCVLRRVLVLPSTVCLRGFGSRERVESVDDLSA